MRFTSLFFSLALPAAATDLVFDTFESDGFGEWAVDGKAFGKSPSATTPNGVNGKITGYSNAYFVSSAHGGDSSTGTLTSPEFEIRLPYLGFKICGGNHKGKTAVQLLIDGKVALEANGKNSLTMEEVVWPLKEHLGKKAQLRVIDTEPGAWGIINADHFVFSDNEKPFFAKAEIKDVPAKEGELVATDIIPGMTVPAGSEVTLFAENKTLGVYSPTALTIDEKGHVYVAETHRFRFGIEDNRNHLYWLMDDMSAQTTADRVAMHEKWQEKPPLEKMTQKSEKIRVLVDTEWRWRG